MEQTEEISLRELIEVLLRGKKTIMIITAAAVILSIIASLLMPSTYVSQATLIANPIEVKDNKKSDESFVDKFQYPALSTETYKEQVKSPYVLQKTIEDLKLIDKAGEPIDTGVLANKINLDVVKDTNLLVIKVSDQDPQMAAKIANKVSENFISFISEQIKNWSLQSAKVLEEQLGAERQKLNEEAEKLKGYLQKSQNIETLRGEVSNLISQVTSYKRGLNDYDKSIASHKKAVELLGKVKRGSVNGSSVDIQIGINGGQAQNIVLPAGNSNAVESAVISANKAEEEAELVKAIAERDALKEKVESLEKQLIKSQGTLATQEYKYNEIQRGYSLAKQTYDAYMQKHKEAIVTAAADIGKSNIMISSQAIPSKSPDSPNKKLNVVIGLILGLMIGVFVAFFKEYWENSAEQSKA